MQVKKFEAPTLQEAIETIKRELGPEAIILQTKQNRRGFGLMSKGSVEVTAAVSDRAVQKKSQAEKKLPEAYAQKIAAAPASRQADFYESYLEKRMGRDQVQLSGGASSRKGMTAVRYADIQDDETAPAASSRNAIATAAPQMAQISAPAHIEKAIEQFSHSKEASVSEIQEELANLRRLVEEMRRERRKPEYIDSDSPLAATEALQEGFEMLIQSGVDRRSAIPLMRDIARMLPVDARADQEAVMDAIAERLLRGIETTSFFQKNQPGVPGVDVFVGSPGAGKTAMIAKLATHASRERQEKVGVIRVSLQTDEGMDPLIVFSKALHVPYRAVSTLEEFQVALQDMSQCNRIFVDTPGIPVRDGAGIRQVASLLKAVSGGRTHLVMSATTRDLDCREQAKAFAVLNPGSLMFSRLDESCSFGGIYSLSVRLGIPVTVFSTGRKVTEQWENATAERLAASILNIL
jgi:flagellar biosynthesis protein FlhF